jgi:hypothetical protein
MEKSLHESKLTALLMACFYRRALATLDGTRHDSQRMDELVSSTNAEFAKAENEVCEIQNRLTVAVARLEVVKASLSLENKSSTSSLATFLQMNELVWDQSKANDDGLLEAGNVSLLFSLLIIVFQFYAYKPSSRRVLYIPIRRSSA